MIFSCLKKDDTIPAYTIINPGNDNIAKTVIVIGCARGGTSMIAGLLRKLGVFMGENIDGPNHEDQDFMVDDQDALMAVMNKRNAKYQLWGWKNTDEGIARLRLILPHLRNPHVIVVFRNILEVAKSFNKHETIGFCGGIQDIGERYQQIGQLVGETTYPLMAINYDIAVTQQINTTKGIVSFLDIRCDKALLQRAANFINRKGGYAFIVEPITLVKLEQNPLLDTAIRQPISIKIKNAQPDGKGYVGTHNDPQFIIKKSDKTSFGTTVMLRFSATTAKGSIRLYYSACSIFTEQNLVDIALSEGNTVLQLDFSTELKQLRIDPSDNNDYFELSGIEVFC